MENNQIFFFFNWQLLRLVFFWKPGIAIWIITLAKAGLCQGNRGLSVDASALWSRLWEQKESTGSLEEDLNNTTRGVRRTQASGVVEVVPQLVRGSGACSMPLCLLPGCGYQRLSCCCCCLWHALKRDEMHHVPTSAAADEQWVARLRVQAVKVL